MLQRLTRTDLQQPIGAAGVRQDERVCIAALLAKESPKTATTTTIVVVVVALALVGLFIYATRRFR
jgi:TRAP-type C4-dicarboxylate transport system permease small subunit